MEGIEGPINFSFLHTTYLNPEQDDFENIEFVVDNPENYEYQPTVFSKPIGSGRVSVVGSYFGNATEDEMTMLANAVSYTSSGMLRELNPESGIIAAGESQEVNILLQSELSPGNYTEIIYFESNDLNNPLVEKSLSYSIANPELVYTPETV